MKVNDFVEVLLYEKMSGESKCERESSVPLEMFPLQEVTEYFQYQSCLPISEIKSAD